MMYSESSITIIAVVICDFVCIIVMRLVINRLIIHIFDINKHVIHWKL